MEVKLALKYSVKIFTAEIYIDQCKQLFEVTLRDGVVAEIYRVGANCHLSISNDTFQMVKTQIKKFFDENKEI